MGAKAPAKVTDAPQRLHKVASIRRGLSHLLKNDPVFSKCDIDLNEFGWTYLGPGFEGLVKIVLSQQVSTAAARTLWNRLNDSVPAVTPRRILKMDADDLRALGISRQKTAYIHGLADAVASRRLDLNALDSMDEGGVHTAITELKGFGAWSAEIYLMFGLARPDIWPAGDLGIQSGMQYYLGLGQRPDATRTRAEGERFAPYRTAAALLMWHIKGTGGLPISSKPAIKQRAGAKK